MKPRRRIAYAVATFVIVLIVAVVIRAGERRVSPARAFANAPATYASLARDAERALLASYYAGGGRWRDCPDRRCWVHNNDWGSDALTNTLFLRWKTTGDLAIPPILSELGATARRYAPACVPRGPCVLWSDAPLWDSVAASREYQATPDVFATLQKAKAAFWAVEGSSVYAGGACPDIRYQRPYGRGDRLKTLETDANGIQAALLLFQATHERRYLAIAGRRYHAVRRYFLDANAALYSVYVFDNGRGCRQVPHRYFASVNGIMIWNGLTLARVTGNAAYRVQALATAHDVVRLLSDANGVYANLQAENDIAEPLFEAMLDVAVLQHGAFARTWILRNAAAAYSARRGDGTYGRFFDGPPPLATSTAWQTNGGFAVEIAAAALDPARVVRRATWRDAPFVRREIVHTPATIRFYGSGIALIGTLGDVCCERGHGRVLVDGLETASRVGTWQNKSSSGKRFPNAVLFAWRWPVAGAHELTVASGDANAKEGGPYLHLKGYDVR